MKKFSLLIVFFLCCLSVTANVYEHKTDFETIAKKIPTMESIHCKFKQEKTMQNIQNPIISSGNFEFKKGEGVYFYTTYPVKTAVNYTNKNYKQINNIVSAISDKKYSKLEKEFDFYYIGTPEKWILGLKPKGADAEFGTKEAHTAEYISDITIEGSDYINKISIVQTNGNKTTLWFSKKDL